VVLLAGCSNAPLRDRLDAAAAQIDRAKDAGAADHAPADLDEAIATLDAARDAQDAAVDATRSAEAARKQAAEDLAEVQKSLAAAEDGLKQAEDAGREAELQLEVVRRRERELARNGLTSDEVGRAIGGDEVLAELRLEKARATAQTLRARIALLHLQEAACRNRISSAGAAIDTAGQQLLFGKALAEQALAAGKIAEARAIAGRKAELDARHPGAPPAPRVKPAARGPLPLHRASPEVDS
jgi:hypothetical protein